VTFLLILLGVAAVIAASALFLYASAAFVRAGADARRGEGEHAIYAQRAANIQIQNEALRRESFLGKERGN
jgi:hypothetical protein